MRPRSRRSLVLSSTTTGRRTRLLEMSASTVHKVRHVVSGLIPNFPNYGVRSMDSSLALIYQGGILIEEQPIYHALELATHSRESTGGVRRLFVCFLKDVSLPDTESSSSCFRPKTSLHPDMPCVQGMHGPTGQGPRQQVDHAQASQARSSRGGNGRSRSEEDQGGCGNKAAKKVKAAAKKRVNAEAKTTKAVGPAAVPPAPAVAAAAPLPR